MLLSDSAGYCEPKACPTGCAIAAGLAARKWFQHGGDLVGWNARPIVVDPQDGFTALAQ